MSGFKDDDCCSCMRWKIFLELRSKDGIHNASDEKIAQLMIKLSGSVLNLDHLTDSVQEAILKRAHNEKKGFFGRYEKGGYNLKKLLKTRYFHQLVWFPKPVLDPQYISSQRQLASILKLHKRQPPKQLRFITLKMSQDQLDRALAKLKMNWKPPKSPTKPRWKTELERLGPVDSTLGRRRKTTPRCRCRQCLNGLHSRCIRNKNGNASGAEVPTFATEPEVEDVVMKSSEDSFIVDERVEDVMVTVVGLPLQLIDLFCTNSISSIH